MNVDSLSMCASHCDFFIDYHIQAQFFISSTHTSYCTFIISLVVVEDALLTLGLLFHYYYFDCFGFLTYTNLPITIWRFTLLGMTSEYIDAPAPLHQLLARVG
jgi:hypothetical protein